MHSTTAQQLTGIILLNGGFQRLTHPLTLKELSPSDRAFPTLVGRNYSIFSNFILSSNNRLSDRTHVQQATRPQPPLPEGVSSSHIPPIQSTYDHGATDGKNVKEVRRVCGHSSRRERGNFFSAHQSIFRKIRINDISTINNALSGGTPSLISRVFCPPAHTHL